MKPTFLIAGTCAAGCSQLTAALRQHPQIYLPRNHRPEPHYFYKSWEFEKPLSHYEETYFSAATTEIARGETSGSYLFGAEFVAPRIRATYPDIKILLSLRNPIERTYAGYRATAFHGLETLSFDEALQREAERVSAEVGIWAEIQPRNYTGRSFYGRQVKAFMKHLPAEQFFFLKSEQTRKDPIAAFKRAYAYLGVSPEFVPAIPPTYTSRSVKDLELQCRLRAYFGSRTDLLIDLIEKGGDPGELAQDSDDLAMIRNLQDNLLPEVQPMSAWARDYLRHLLADDMRLLADLVPFSIDDWF